MKVVALDAAGNTRTREVRYPVHIDDLARHLRQPVGPLAGILARLELKGIVCQEPGKYFVRHTDYCDHKGP